MRRIASIILAIVIIISALSINVCATQTSGITNGGIYRLKNVSSGKYLNVDYGVDENETNVYQYSGDGSVEQTFRVVYDSTYDAYRFYTMSSINGHYRVLDVVKNNGSVSSGCNLEIYKPTDPVAQYFKIVQVSGGQYKIVARSNTSVAITANSGNGTSSGTSSSSTGNAYMSTYSGNTNQLWVFELATDNHETYYESMDWGYPFTSSSASLSSGYGYRYLNSSSRSFHSGIDIAASGGTTIYSVNDGTLEDAVYEVGSLGSRGYYAVVKSSTDNVYGTMTPIRVVYMHMKSATSLVYGNSVSKGITIIGKVGTTGDSTGNHLHLGVISNGSTVGTGKKNTIDPFLFYPNILNQYSASY